MGLESYDLDFYKKEYNKNSAEEFIRYVEEVESIIKENNWSLETKYNKNYVSFKAGFFNAFGIKWIGTKTFAFFFKLDEEEVENLEVQIDMTKYDSQWKEAIYYIDSSKTASKDLLPLFELAYKKLTG
ncbi:MAG: hypothetical protein HVN35_01435 [Methanobacteriaceae archaeon]|nr:hypothetical protein [Methanobacteriaceae archaeon]